MLEPFAVLGTFYLGRNFLFDRKAEKWRLVPRKTNAIVRVDRGCEQRGLRSLDSPC
jgi:hypothetical protein